MFQARLRDPCASMDAARCAATGRRSARRSAAMAASPGHTGAQRSNWHPALLASVLCSNRLTLLSCEPGAARDAMLRRGLMPLLQPLRSDSGVADCALRFDNWGVLPLQALR